MNRTTCLAVLLLTLSGASRAEAQPQPDWLRTLLEAEEAPEPQASTRSAVLMVEDEGRPALSERVGALLYRRFLLTGAYERVITILGRKDANARLAAATLLVGARVVARLLGLAHQVEGSPDTAGEALRRELG